MMKTRTKLLLPLMLLCIAVFAMVLTASAETKTGKCGDNLTYTLDTGTGVLEISGTGTMKKWLDSDKVPWYANRSSIRIVKIANGVTNIGGWAFCPCYNLTSITIPDSVTSIGNYAFEGCSSLTSITISDSVTSIGDYAFDGCSSLKSVTISDSVTSIGDGAFCGCSSLKAVYITDLAAWCKISFGDNAANPLYYAHNLYLNGELVTNLVIPDSVTSIGKYALSGCSSLKSITILNPNCQIGATIPSTATIYGYTGSTAAAYAKEYGRTFVSIGGSCGESLTFRMDYDTGILSITGTGAMHSWYFDDSPWYAHRTSIRSIQIASGATSIGDFAFDGCSNLVDVMITETVESIGDGAFDNCEQLEKVTILGENCRIVDSAAAFPANAVIYGRSDSTAEAYAAKYNRKFISLGHIHVYADNYTVDVPASCTATGEKSRHCTYKGCTKTIDSMVIPAAGHKFGGWKVRTPAKCEETGVDYRVCSVCTHEETRTTDKLGHSYATTWTVDTPANCTTPGSKSHHCTRCDAKTDITAVSVNDDHDYSTAWTVDTPANCTTPGSKSHHCIRCDAKTDITEIPKTAHTYVDGICKDCGKVKPPYTPGVVTGEGEEPAKKDLLRLQKYLAGWDVEINEAAADCNGDGKVTKMDLLRLQKYLAGWDVKLGE